MKIYTLFLSVIILFFGSCGSDTPNDNITPPEKVKTPFISQVTGSCFYGSTVVINGINFSPTIADHKVMFGDLEGEIVKATNTSLTVITPKLGEVTSVEVKIIMSNETSNTKKVMVDVEQNRMASYECYITGVTSSCFYGSTVVITGVKFSQTIADQKVMFGDLEAEVVKATPTSLTVITPKLGEVTSAEIVVIKSGKSSNTKEIKVDVEKNYIATYDWITYTVKPDVLYKTAQFNLFNALRRIHILDVTLSQDNTLGIGVSSPFKSTVAICNDYNAEVGINAGYFPIGTSTPKNPYIRINGQKVQDGDSPVNAIFTNAALLIQDNVATIQKLGNSTILNKVASEISTSKARDIIVCGPMLVTDGVIENLDMGNSHNSSSTARTGLGVSADGKRVLMVVVDYNGGVTGVSTLQLAILLRALGAENAMNFDGGGSSTMFVKNQGDNGRVSTNTYSQRNVHSIIYVK